MINKKPNILEVNGITLILDKNDYVGRAAIDINIAVGSTNEPDGKRGISHVLEHMIFQGSELRNIDDYTKIFDSYGADINGFTTYDFTAYTLSVLSEYITQTLDVLMDLVCNPKFDPELLEKEKKVILEEMNQELDDNDSYLGLCIFYKICEGTDYQIPIIGKRKDIESITVEDLKSYHSRYYAKPNIVVSVSGNFNTDEIIAFFNSHSFNEPLPEFTKSNIHPGKINDHYHLPKGSKTQLLIPGDFNQSLIAMGNICPKFNSNTSALTTIASMIFGGGISSRLFLNVRNKNGYCYQIYNTSSKLNHIGSVVTVAYVNTEYVDEAINVILNEYEKFYNDGITIEEFNNAVLNYKYSWIKSMESIDRCVARNSRQILFKGKENFQTIQDKIEDIDKITIDDVNKYIREYYNPENLHIMLLQNHQPLKRTDGWKGYKLDNREGKTNPYYVPWLDPKELR